MLAKKVYQNHSFSEILEQQEIKNFVDACTSFKRDRCFSADVTLFTFLAQVLSEKHSCKDALSRLCGELAALGEPGTSMNTSNYVRARKKLSLEALSEL